MPLGSFQRTSEFVTKRRQVLLFWQLTAGILVKESKTYIYVACFNLVNSAGVAEVFEWLREAVPI